MRQPPNQNGRPLELERPARLTYPRLTYPLFPRPRLDRMPDRQRRPDCGPGVACSLIPLVEGRGALRAFFHGSRGTALPLRRVSRREPMGPEISHIPRHVVAENPNGIRVSPDMMGSRLGAVRRLVQREVKSTARRAHLVAQVWHHSLGSATNHKWVVLRSNSQVCRVPGIP